MSAGVDPGLVKAAKAKTGLKNDSDLISAALAVIAALGRFRSVVCRAGGSAIAGFQA
jgi:hypothetical protein